MQSLTISVQFGNSAAKPAVLNIDVIGPHSVAGQYRDSSRNTADSEVIRRLASMVGPTS